MKKKLFLILAVVAIAISCTKNDNIPSITVEIPGGASQITLDRLGGDCSVNIKGDGEWYIEVEKVAEDELEWIMPIQEKGSGNAKVEFIVDHNLSGVSRKSEVKIVSKGGEAKTFTVLQTELLNGAPLDNDDTDYYDAFVTKGLGLGFDIKNVKIMTNSIFKTSAIENLLKDGKLSDLYSEQKLSGQGMHILDQDSIVNKQDSIGVDLSVNISFGKFKLNIQGEYHSSEKLKTWNKTYHTQISVPHYRSALQYDNIVASYLDTNIDSEIRKKIFTSGFAGKMRALRKKLPKTNEYNTKEDVKTVKRLLQSLDRAYGPVFVSSSVMGGEIMIQLKADTTLIDEQLKITGKVNMAIKSVVSIEANINAAYQKAGEEILKNSNVKFVISGGSRNTQNGVVNKIVEVEKLNSETIRQAVDKWSESIILDPKNEGNNTAEVINIEVTPIWVLFADEENDNYRVSDAVEMYMKEKYGDIVEKTVVNINNFKKKK